MPSLPPGNREKSGLAEDRLWTRPKYRYYLQCSKTMLDKMVRTGKIPCVRIGALVRFRPEAVKKWVEEQEVSFGEEDRDRMERVKERILRSVNRS